MLYSLWRLAFHVFYVGLLIAVEIFLYGESYVIISLISRSGFGHNFVLSFSYYI